ncbi:AraC family transcriptional regulator [Comamonas sp. w2-DMI]|uniref:AraC family transcriptional regulator n=1 Tax=Comamonas sp. w2-DMI TaxID=3126391 RepID=UPI0032E475FE
MLDKHVIADTGLFTEYMYLHDASSQKSDLLERESRTLLFLRRLFERHAHAEVKNVVPVPRTVGIVKDMLHANATATVSILDLASEAGVSETQVIRSFSEEIGMPPHAYLVALRVEHAKRLIRFGLPLAAVAADCGFTDQSHMHRHFKRLTGITPGDFAKAMSGR